MKRITKQIFSVALCLLLLLSMLPLGALGTEDDLYLIGEGTLEFADLETSSDGIYINFVAASDGTVKIDLLEMDDDYHVIVYENNWWLTSFNGTEVPDSVEFPVQTNGKYSVIFSLVDYHTEELDAWTVVTGSLTYKMTSDVPVSDVTQWPLEDPRQILEAAYALEEGTCLPHRATLTGEITYIESYYDPYYENISVVMAVPGCEDMPVLCYRLYGEGADTLTVGDTITVSGSLANYYGTIEFEQGCSLETVVKGDYEAPVPPEDPKELVDAAYALEPGTRLPYISILTGEIISIDTPYSETYKNITVTIVIEGREENPIVCYRMKGDGVDTLAVGDTITVKGVLQNYAKIGEYGDILYTTIEFDTGCQLLDASVGMVQLYCYAPWEQCYVYSWDSDNLETHSGPWPGTLMIDLGNGMWTCKVPEEAEYLIFNSGTGNQTHDLSVPTDHRVLYVVKNDEWMLFSDPDTWGPDSLTIAGSGLPGITEWNPADSAGDMIEISDHVYQKILNLTTGTTISFKFVANHTWDESLGGGSSIILGQSTPLDASWGCDPLEIFIAEDCQLVFTVDLNPLTIGDQATLLVQQLNPTEQPRSLTVFAPDSWIKAYAYTWGDYNFGDFPGKELQSQDGYYLDVINSNLVNLVITGQKADATLQQTADIFLQPGNEPVSVVIYEDGTHTVIYGNPSVDTYRVVGDAAWMGDWNCASDAGLMKQVSNGVYEKCFENVQPGIYQFKITKNGLWDDAIGDDGLNFTFTVTSVADVTVTYYRVTEKVDIAINTLPNVWGPDSLALVGSGIPGISEWHPEDPAGDMVKVSDYVYEKVLDATAGTSMIFRIAGNDMWDDNWNFGGMYITLGQKIDLQCNYTSSNLELSVTEDCRLKFTVDLKPMIYGGNATLLVEKINTPPASRKLTVYVPDTWTNVNAYTWEPEAFGAWPGARIQKNGNSYQAVIPRSMTNLILNSQDDALGLQYQTDDIHLEANGKDVIITVHEDGSYTVHYEGDISHARPLTIVVPSASWNTIFAYTWNPESFGDYPGKRLASSEDIIYREIISSQLENLVISGILADGTSWHTDDIHLEPGIRPVTVMLREDFTYTIIYDNSPSDVDTYRVVGSASWMGNWDSASDTGLMEETSNGVYQKRFENVEPGIYEFKITKNGKWDDAIGHPDGSNFEFTVSQVSDVVVACIFDTGDALVSIDIYHVEMGDVTGDEQVNLGDVARLYAHCRGTKTLTDATALAYADFNNDGNVNIGDVASIYTYVRWYVRTSEMIPQ